MKMDRAREMHEYAMKCAQLLSAEFHVERIYIIGSVASGKVHESSDIDLAVEGLKDREYIRALTALYDIVPPGVELNLIPLENAYDSLKEHARARGECVYG
jgi:predicted nucleotidyltransferase